MADPTQIINETVKQTVKKNKGFSDPKNADKHRLKTQEIRGTRGTEKLRSGLRREERRESSKLHKQEQTHAHVERRISREQAGEVAIRRDTIRGAQQDARQRAYSQFRAQQQLQLNQQRMEQRAAFQKSQQPTFLNRTVQQPIQSDVEAGTTSVAIGIFRMFAVIVGLSMLYLIVSQKGNPGAVGAIQGIGGFLYRLTGTTPLVTVKSNTPL